VEAHREGVPMMRAMVLEFPDDPASATLERQYFLGGSLLVVPVLSEDGSVDYYLPAGRWTHLLSGEVQSGGRWHQAKHDFFSLPLFVRPGTVLALGARDERPDYDFASGVTFRVYELADGASVSCEVPGPGGATALRCTVGRIDRQIDATVEGGTIGAWRLQLAGVPAVTVPAGAGVTPDPLGVIVAPAAGSKSVRLSLPASSNV
jgi:alpha-D-xyloside xylohydrolase